MFCQAILYEFQYYMNLFLASLDNMNYSFIYISSSCRDSSLFNLYSLLCMQIGSLPLLPTYVSKYIPCGVVQALVQGCLKLIGKILYKGTHFKITGNISEGYAKLNVETCESCACRFT